MKVTMLLKCQVSFVSAASLEPTWLLLIYTSYGKCRSQDSKSYTWHKTYRERVERLLLPVNRFEEAQVADYPGRGRAEYRRVVVQGDLQHGVFRLSTERCTKRTTLPWRYECFIILLPRRSCGAEETHQTVHFELKS